MKNSEAAFDSRLAKFGHICRYSAYYRKLALKLSEAEFDECVFFLEDHKLETNDDYTLAVNRMHMDKEKSKNWKIVEDLLLASRVQS